MPLVAAIVGVATALTSEVTCGQVRDIYRQQACCDTPSAIVPGLLVPVAPSPPPQLCPVVTDGAAASSICAVDVLAETTSVGQYPPDSIDPVSRVVDADGFPASCPNYSPEGYPPCSGMCSSYQGAVDAIAKACASSGMPQVGTSGYWNAFKAWYTTTTTTSPSACKSAGAFVVTFARLLNTEYLYKENALDAGTAWLVSVYNDSSVVGLTTAETASNTVSAMTQGLQAVNALLSTITDPALQGAIGVASLTFVNHYKVNIDFAKSTREPVVPTIGTLSLFDYNIASNAPTSCTVWPEHFDICLASRNMWAFSQTVKPICFPEMAQVPWTCSNTGMSHFKAQSIILGIEKAISTASIDNRPALCAATATPEKINGLWQQGGVDLLFSNEGYSCLLNPSLQPCGPAPLMSQSNFELLLAWWLIFGDVHLSAIARYCPATTYAGFGNPTDFFATTLTLAELASLRYTYTALHDVSGTGDDGFPTASPIASSGCPSRLASRTTFQPMRSFGAMKDASGLNFYNALNAPH